jgi:hypothetical protein
LISFVSEVKKVDKVDEPDTDKTEFMNLEVLMDPDEPYLDSKYS